MKNLKVSACIILLLFLGTFSVNAQEEKTETVVIRATEFAGRTQRSGMVTIDAEGKISKVDLKRGGWDESGANAATIQKEIEKWKQEGYVITHYSTAGEAIFRTTVILER